MEIPDAVKLIIKATENLHGGDIYILKMRAFKLSDLLDVILKRIGPRLKMKKEDILVKETGLVPGEKLHEDLLSDSECTRLYECDNMYVIYNDNDNHSKDQNIKKGNLSRYSSDDVDLISKKQIEEIILKYLDGCLFFNH
jgi:FlaA1/EpsC-like NDP-sugar epimerase